MAVTIHSLSSLLDTDQNSHNVTVLQLWLLHGLEAIACVTWRLTCFLLHIIHTSLKLLIELIPLLLHLRETLSQHLRLPLQVFDLQGVCMPLLQPNSKVLVAYGTVFNVNAHAIHHTSNSDFSATASKVAGYFWPRITIAGSSWLGLTGMNAARAGL